MKCFICIFNFDYEYDLDYDSDFMITRFSLYGFLKNLRFFEPFFLLFLREKGLSFFEIGFLFSFREICINIMEIPSGALADLYGRKTVMLISLLSYIVSFVIFGSANSTSILFAAMFFFAIGEAFRTGTHKAMIFDWLRHENMVDQKTKIYGFTRSWSQKGSALSVLLASILVFYSGNYSNIFWYTIIPYVFGFINMALYPAWLNRKVKTRISIKGIFIHLWNSGRSILKDGKLRNLIVQSILYTGQYKAIREYLQVIIKAQVILIPVALYLTQEKRIAILVGIVYFVLYLLASFSSKNSFRLINLLGSKEKASSLIFILTLLTLIISAIGTYFEIYIIPIIGFIIIFSMNNLFRPILIAQFDDCAKSEEQATILSVESQVVSFGVFILAPIIGYAADKFGLYSVFLVSSFALGLYIIPIMFKR